MALPLPELEGKYEILQKIKEGGMGAIYKVRHLLLDEIRVIKVIKPQIEDVEGLKERFFNEARAATRLRHPNIALLHDFSLTDDGTGYMVMEYIEGRTLQEIIRKEGPPPLELTLEIALQALEAIEYLHQHKVVHRDISPDNLMLTVDHRGNPLVKLIDLGLAKALESETGLTKTNQFIGKYRYASPESFTVGTARVGPATDLYSFGIVLYELLTGRFPIPGSDEGSVIAGHMFGEVLGFDESDPEGRVPDQLRELTLRALEKEPEKRASAASISTGITEVRAQIEVPTPLIETVIGLLEPSVLIEVGKQRAPGTTQVELDDEFPPEPTDPLLETELLAPDPPPTGLIEDSEPPGSDVPPSRQPPAGTPAPPSWSRALIAGVAAAAVVILAVAWWLLSNRPGAGGESEVPLAETTLLPAPDDGLSSETGLDKVAERGADQPGEEEGSIKAAVVTEQLVEDDTDRGTQISTESTDQPKEGPTPAVAAPAPVLAKLAIRSNETGVEILLDGQRLGPAPQNVELDAGRYLVELRKDGCEGVSQWVNLAQGVQERLLLQMSCVTTGQLEVTSEIAGAVVFVNGEERGTAPLVLALEAGDFNVELRQTGCRGVAERVSLAVGVEKTVRPALQCSVFVLITSADRIFDAEVWVEGKRRGVVGDSIELAVNRIVSLELRREGCQMRPIGVYVGDRRAWTDSGPDLAVFTSVGDDAAVLGLVERLLDCGPQLPKLSVDDFLKIGPFNRGATVRDLRREFGQPDSETAMWDFHIFYYGSRSSHRPALWVDKKANRITLIELERGGEEQWIELGVQPAKLALLGLTHEEVRSVLGKPYHDKPNWFRYSLPGTGQDLEVWFYDSGRVQKIEINWYETSP